MKTTPDNFVVNIHHHSLQRMDWYRDYQHCGVLMASVIWSLKFNDDWLMIISIFPISVLPRREESKINQNLIINTKHNPHRARHDREGMHLCYYYLSTQTPKQVALVGQTTKEGTIFRAGTIVPPWCKLKLHIAAYIIT